MSPSPPKPSPPKPSPPKSSAPKSSAPKSPQTQTAPQISAGVARQIDENLRRIYAAKLSEDIPDRLQDLLRQLREKDAAP